MESRRRMQLYRTMHLWHWISAAVCFAALTLFTVTGITLNHASAISAEPVVAKRRRAVTRNSSTPARGGRCPIRGTAGGDRRMGRRRIQAFAARRDCEWSEEELYLSAPGPGRDAWVSIDRASGMAKFEKTDRGWLAYFNDLHKGRNTGIAWIDLHRRGRGRRPVLFADRPGAVVDPGASAHVHLAAGRRRHRPCHRAHDFLRTFLSTEHRMIRKTRIALALALAAFGGAAHAADLSLSVEIPQLPVAEYHRPYVAIWIEGADQNIAANLAVWYQVRGDHTKWLPDLRQWWRRGGRDLKVPVDGLTGATRPVGQHLLKFDAAQAPLAGLKPGQYTVVVEAVREVGGREAVRIPFEWPIKAAKRESAKRQQRARRRGADAQSLRGEAHMKNSSRRNWRRCSSCWRPRPARPREPGCCLRKPSWRAPAAG